jgi:threonine/homoserine/homoserine lactone efflux protein
MQLKANQSLLGGILAFIIATSCCWLPALAIMLGGASGLMAFSQGLEKFSRFFMIIGGGFLIYGGYQFYKKKWISSVNCVS